MRSLVLAAVVSFAMTPTSFAADTTSLGRPLENVPVVGDLLKADAEQFAQKAHDDGVAEVTLARLALNNSGDAEVKDFANDIIKDHARANKELAKIINEENIKMSDKPNDEATDTAEKLASLTGKDFDRAYMDDMVDAHENAVDLFEDYGKDGDNAKLKRFAEQMVPTLRAHLDQAKVLDARLGQM